jgi:hypothetical protein
MTRMRVLGLSLVGAIAASFVLAAGASATEYNLKMLPELGRCHLVGRGAEFRGSKCVRSEPGIGTYQWLSGPGAKNKFTGSLKEPIELQVRGTSNLSNASTVCSSATLSGEYTGPKNLKITSLVFQGCRSGEGECQNKAGSTDGEITAEELVGELGFISHPKRLKVGWDLKPATGSNLASFECGGAEKTLGKSIGGGATREVQASVIGKIEPVNHMTTSLGVVFALDKHGAQFPERFEGGVKDTLTTILGEKLPGTGKSTHPAVFLTTASLHNEEPLEVLGKCTGAAC